MAQTGTVGAVVAQTRTTGAVVAKTGTLRAVVDQKDTSEQWMLKWAVVSLKKGQQGQC